MEQWNRYTGKQQETNNTQKMRTRQNPERLEAIVAYIIGSQIDTLALLSVDNLSKKFQIDRSNLFRLFKEQLSATPEEFIMKQKLIAAAEMIMSGTMPLSVEEISRKLGYCRTDYFIKCFKKFMAITPGGLITLEERRRNGETFENVNIFKSWNNVSHLVNANYFLLDFACIIDEEDAFRLIVYDRKKNYYLDRNYKTWESAKNTFKEMFKDKYAFGTCFVYWTPFLRAVRSWINSRNNILKSVPRVD